MPSRASASWQLWVGAWLLRGMLILTGSACSKKSAPTEPNPRAPIPNKAPPQERRRPPPIRRGPGVSGSGPLHPPESNGRRLHLHWQSMVNVAEKYFMSPSGHFLFFFVL